MEAVKKQTLDDNTLLQDQRMRIDAIDVQIINLIAQRFDVVEEVIEIKRQNDIPAVLEDRFEQVICNVRKLAVEKSVDPEIIDAMYRELVGFTCEYEDIKLHPDEI